MIRVHAAQAEEDKEEGRRRGGEEERRSYESECDVKNFTSILLGHLHILATPFT